MLVGPLGRLGLPRGSPWGHFGIPLAALGCWWDNLGHVGLPSGGWDGFGSKYDVRLRDYFERLRCLRTKSDLAEVARISPPHRIIHAKWRKSRSSQPHFTRAGGQDDVNSEQTPSK